MADYARELRDGGFQHAHDAAPPLRFIDAIWTVGFSFPRRYAQLLETTRHFRTPCLQHGFNIIGVAHRFLPPRRRAAGYTSPCRALKMPADRFSPARAGTPL